MTCFLPCVTYAENVTELDKDHSFGKHCCLYFTTIPCCLWIFAYTRRFTLRQKYGLPFLYLNLNLDYDLVLDPCRKRHRRILQSTSVAINVHCARSLVK
ncbi:hypothetical protein BSKO_05575 [Bryopsis sp. KO-2023]|nr:hypothetical protein BSKO_05575 [Bryopsis sp. KO-2023]